ncbi:MAG: hypothetical protein HY890_07465 [Deltaproteobacteria bacterium]|nr:hypothetical protein [Deltaproteobacteria bacterium]
MELLRSGFSLKRLQVWLAGLTVITLVVILFPIQGLATEIAGSGNFEAGRRIYTGERRLINGGPPCISCHTAGEVGTFGGGTLGPDLTKVWENKFFLIDPNWINSEGVPVMGAIFSKKNITPEEVEDLKAFFSVVAAEQQSNPGTGRFVSGGIIGTIIMLIIFSIVWSDRYRKRTGGTAHDALWRNYGGKGKGGR